MWNKFEQDVAANCQYIDLIKIWIKMGFSVFIYCAKIGLKCIV